MGNTPEGKYRRIFLLKYIGVVPNSPRPSFAPATEIENACNPVGTGLTNIVDVEVESVKSAVGDLAASLSCGALTPLYQSLMHESFCQGVADNLSWLWISSLVYTLAVLIMNTTRRAYLDDTILSEEEIKQVGACELRSDECPLPIPRFLTS